ncbi:DUF7281 domain-containing protein [Dysgonomonas macrotermitis]|uniref:DUF7281 domain-containing protein n=1 Tax=Dysgonomonas macrotermitis TaxID=1346286 RepID=A0A1M4W589_9BACT|nr:hypothetical protein [Dysgonomonas macrotermitis]SHE76132.1 hypothetical protein SAMN05444362_102124 [Dysgonomonas macrotermitis]
MEKLSLSIAEKLLLLRNGEKIQASRLQQAIFRELIIEKILHKTGKSRGHILLLNIEQFDLYLQNHYSIINLDEYILVLKQESISRADLIGISTDSKLTKSRSFKGFLVNCYEPIEVRINQKRTFLHPMPGLFHFVYDFENFVPNEQLTIVGIENPESFRYIEKQKYLFNDIKPLFISRYPQNQHADIIRWLKSIPNTYLHFGDFDIASINIYMNEFKKHIPDRCSFFVPSNIAELLERYGNDERYNKQKLHINVTDISEEMVIELIKLIHQHKKGLDQEVFQILIR